MHTKVYPVLNNQCVTDYSWPDFQKQRMTLNNNGNIVTVGVGDLKIAKSPNIIKTSLGSCVGVVLYDNLQNIRGMLPLMARSIKAGRYKRTSDIT